ncbi:hypothetical protein BY458DRAFT_319944 [Sporodiniella umbellata]|nr:hypothetical protein BY458DRAFT_319944 [Sporodiniella umbellata]
MNGESRLLDMKKLEREINEIRQKSYSDDAETADPFNRLWSVVEPMMDKLPDSINHSGCIDTYIGEEEGSLQLKKDLSDALLDCLPSNMQDDRLDFEEAKKENEELGQKLDGLQKKIKIMEKKSIDNTALKSSIIQFKSDVHKQAKILLQNQEHSLMTRSAMIAGRPTAGHSTAEMSKNEKKKKKKQYQLYTGTLNSLLVFFFCLFDMSSQ